MQNIIKNDEIKRGQKEIQPKRGEEQERISKNMRSVRDEGGGNGDGRISRIRRRHE